MNHDAMIAIRFLTEEEGGRKRPIHVGTYRCPMLVDGMDIAFDCRIEVEKCSIELGQWCCLPVRFLFLEDALSKIVVGQGIALLEGKLVAKGMVVEIAN